MLGITIKAEWDTEPVEGDGSICQNCSEPIYGKKFVGYLFIYDNSGQIPSDVIPKQMRVCEDCRSEMNKRNVSS